MRSKTINRQPITVSAEARRPRKERCAHHHQATEDLSYILRCFAYDRASWVALVKQSTKIVEACCSNDGDANKPSSSLPCSICEQILVLASNTLYPLPEGGVQEHERKGNRQVSHIPGPFDKLPWQEKPNQYVTGERWRGVKDADILWRIKL
ncbi:hypothetical protein RRG08_032921 [Elysia crispata]|uniref:Uncharacterized protein n=1 Tax=Elysia crispata TaxID=231223 RepID=A0AAE1A6F5_9GAST|nr:hypothetical protein RRG08_032921 [Elysia crispata]